jgi:hypothetical protein
MALVRHVPATERPALTRGASFSRGPTAFVLQTEKSFFQKATRRNSSRLWHIGMICVRAILKMQHPRKARLTKIERERILKAYYLHTHNYQAPPAASIEGEARSQQTSIASIRELLAHCGQLTTDGELTELLVESGYKVGQMFQIYHFISVMEFLKKRFEDSQATTDAETAFEGLAGGQGTVALSTLLSLCEDFQLGREVTLTLEANAICESSTRTSIGSTALNASAFNNHQAEGVVGFTEFRELLDPSPFAVSLMQPSGQFGAIEFSLNLPPSLSKSPGNHPRGFLVDDRSDDEMRNDNETPSGLESPRSGGWSSGPATTSAGLRRQKTLANFIAANNSPSSTSFKGKGALSGKELEDSSREDESTYRGSGVSRERIEQLKQELMKEFSQTKYVSPATVASRERRERQARLAANSSRSTTPRRPMSTTRGFGGSSSRFTGEAPLIPLPPPSRAGKVAPLRPHRAEQPLPNSARHRVTGVEAEEAAEQAKEYAFSARPMTAGSQTQKSASLGSTGNTKQNVNSVERGGNFSSTQRSTQSTKEPFVLHDSAQFNPFLGVPLRETSSVQQDASATVLALASTALVDAAQHHRVGDVYLPLICRQIAKAKAKERKRMSRIQAKNKSMEPVLVG